jgi:sugar lactone lactonase YvrE
MYIKSLFSVVSIFLLLWISHTSNAQNPKPDNIVLPDGFQPEGITLGVGPQILAGSLVDGSIYSADLITGEGNLVIEPETPRMALGLSFDQRSRLLFVAGGFSGTAYVYDPSTGQEVANYQLVAAPPTLINDVIVTREAAYFTDSAQPIIFRLPFGPGGKLPGPQEEEPIFLGGEFIFIPGTINANGIEASPDGRWLLVINSVTGELYRVDPDDGDATIRIDLGGELLPSGDGIVREGLTLYVVQSTLNQVSVIELAPDFASGEVISTITDEDFDTPSTAALFDGSLYAVNARFSTPPTPTTTYSIVAVPK